MRIVVLSDFTGTQLQAAEERHRALHAAQVAQHAAAVDRVCAANARRLAAPVVEWRAGRYGAALLAYARRLLTAPLPLPPAPPSPTRTREMNILETGQAGEQAVRSELAGILDDGWTAITGYKNPRGEVDLILVGPPGVLALEVKAINGKVCVNGDSWWRDKYDRYGNLVETQLPITDQAGRSPSRQLNEPVDMLQTQLARRSVWVPVHRGVVLAHHASQLGDVSNPTVQFVGLISDLRRYVLAQHMTRPGHGSPLVQRVVEIVCADHQFHAKRYHARAARAG